MISGSSLGDLPRSVPPRFRGGELRRARRSHRHGGKKVYLQFVQLIRGKSQLYNKTFQPVVMSKGASIYDIRTKGEGVSGKVD